MSHIKKIGHCLRLIQLSIFISLLWILLSKANADICVDTPLHLIIIGHTHSDPIEVGQLNDLAYQLQVAQDVVSKQRITNDLKKKVKIFIERHVNIISSFRDQMEIIRDRFRLDRNILRIAIESSDAEYISGMLSGNRQMKYKALEGMLSSMGTSSEDFDNFFLLAVGPVKYLIFKEASELTGKIIYNLDDTKLKKEAKDVLGEMQWASQEINSKVSVRLANETNRFINKLQGQDQQETKVQMDVFLAMQDKDISFAVKKIQERMNQAYQNQDFSSSEDFKKDIKEVVENLSPDLIDQFSQMLGSVEPLPQEEWDSFISNAGLFTKESQEAFAKQLPILVHGQIALLIKRNKYMLEYIRSLRGSTLIVVGERHGDYLSKALKGDCRYNLEYLPFKVELIQVDVK